MAGNVSEWVNDWYGSYPSEPQVNPTGHADGEDRVLRGGRWNGLERRIHAAYRDSGAPGLADDYTGLRCVVGPGG
jgi:formylglycine-generating enzyme required for sulfatase activity